MFLVTECETHGTKVTESNASARVFRDLSRECIDDEKRFPTKHAEWHEEEATDCWRCCHLMRVGRDWEQETL